MICAFCKIDIEDDSIFCDQCGKEIFLCPKCQKPGKGKVCIYDGTKLESVKNNQSSSESLSQSSTESTPHPITSPEIQIEEIEGKIPVLNLVNRNLKIFLKIEHGDILGRTSGRFTDVFHQYRWISGKHLKFEYKEDSGWNVIELGSKNGAKYKKIRLNAFEPTPLKDNTFLLMGKIEFFVQIEDPKKKIQTETIRLH